MLIALCSIPPMEEKEGTPVPAEDTTLYRHSCPYNIYLLSAIMEEAGYEIVIKDLNAKDFTIDGIIEELINFDVIMVSSNSWNWNGSKWVIERLRLLRQEQIIVIGGLQATLFGRNIIEEFPVNYVVRGEAEKSIIPLLRLIEKKGSPEDVPGLIYKENDNIKTNPVSRLITPEEMSQAPVPLYERLPAGIYNVLPIESSRGCVNNCIYCSIPYKRSWRPLSPQAVVNRIESYIPYLNKVLTEKLLFIDDSFIIDINRSLEIARLLRERKIEIEAMWNCHVLELSQEKMLLELNPYTNAIFVGVESFNEENLKRIGKKFTPEDILKGVKIAEKLGISKKLLFSFIIGFPWQNKEAIIEEINKIYDLIYRTDICAMINWFTLHPGSQIWNEFYQKNKVSLRDYGRLVIKWRDEVIPVKNREMNEINFYIKYLQDTIPGGKYRFQSKIIIQ